MNTKSIYFVKAITGEEDNIHDGLSQVAFIGRSNVGKSSVINAIANNKSLARSSSTPGRTQEINFFSFNDEYYLVDLPGYGYAQVSRQMKEVIRERIMWYFSNEDIPTKKVVLIIDAKVGPTIDDLDMLTFLRDNYHDIIILANKIDKLTKSEQITQLKKIQNIVGLHKVLPFSAEKRTGVDNLMQELTAIE